MRRATFVAVCALLFGGTVHAQEVTPDFFAGKWNWHMRWAGGGIEDSGAAEGRVTGDTVEIACTDGCKEPSFLRGTVQSTGEIAWEFWTKHGVLGDCKNDEGWKPVRLIVGEDQKSFTFRYFLHTGDNCDQLLRAAPVGYRVTRD